jgi:Ca-activated chloride channel family protein
MIILYPSLLWLLIPLVILFYYRPKQLIDTVHLIILMLLLVALSRPVLEQEPTQKQIEAKDIIIALDVSYSMRADDISPNRYEYAKATIDTFLQNNPGDNITLIAFTTNPLLLSPPTTDHQLISLALKSLKLENILTHGTSLEKLFKRVAKLPIKEKNVVLITDGGEESNLAALSDIIDDNTIRPVVLAMGTTSGSTIKKADGSLLKDAQGNLVVSRINPLLENLATQNNGYYISASGSVQNSADKLQDALNNLDAEKNLILKTTYSYMELYPVPLLIALILFLLLHTRGVKYLLLLAALFGTQASASIFDLYHLEKAYQSYHEEDFNRSKEILSFIGVVSLQSQVALANSSYKLGEYEKAIKLYRGIRSTTPQIKQQLYYNIANAYAKLEDYDNAKQYYIKALQLGEDEDARYNLDLIVFLKKQQETKLGVSPPKSQESSGSQTESKESEKESKSEDQQGSGSGDGGKAEQKERKEKMKLIEEYQSEEQPLSTKVYEMINRGYINEKQPW